MSSKGKAKNGLKSGPRPSINETPSNSPFPQSTSQAETSEAVNNCVIWKRPPGIKGEKRKLEDSEFKRKKLKLLEKANSKSSLRIAEARRANDIQEKLVKIEQDELDCQFILQDLNDCPDETISTAAAKLRCYTKYSSPREI